jgi:hypothetical protein
MDWQSASSQLRNKIREVKAPDFEALALEVFVISYGIIRFIKSTLNFYI